MYACETLSLTIFAPSVGAGRSGNAIGPLAAGWAVQLRTRTIPKPTGRQGKAKFGCVALWQDVAGILHGRSQTVMVSLPSWTSRPFCFVVAK